MVLNEDFYIFPEDLYRVGNSTSPKWEKIREDEITTTVINGITMIVANGLGLSVYSENEVQLAPLTGWAWKIKKGTVMPAFLRLVNDKPGHYLVAPTQLMPIDEYKGHLSKLVVHSEKCLKLKEKV